MNDHDVGAPSNDPSEPNEEGDGIQPVVDSFSDSGTGEAEKEVESGYVDAVFGADAESFTVVTASAGRSGFAPWHHPVKQIVRDYQWASLVQKLITEQRAELDRGCLRYFTLPGADLLDVRVLADSLSTLGTRIEYFGFDSGYEDENSSDADLTGAYLSAESALRQAGRISDRAEILRDRLEDIALTGSHASERLRQRGVFDVVNIDACNHLGYKPAGRSSSIFEALEKLLAHQLRADEPWLLFITTRANVAQLGVSAMKLQSAIHKNLELHTKDFANPLADCISGKIQTIAADMNDRWAVQSPEFLKIFCVGLSKYLLQYYHAQQNLPAKVELASAFAYKVSSVQPDMLSLAYRITPKGLLVQPPSAGGAIPLPAIELSQAVSMIAKTKRMWNLDDAIANDPKVRAEAVFGTGQSGEEVRDKWLKW